MKIFISVLASVHLLSTVTPALAANATPEELGEYAVAIAYAEDRGILEPMNDGLMHPEMPISRSDLVSSIVRDVYKKDILPECFERIASSLPATYTHLFTDVPVAHTKAREICVGMFVGIVEGQPDGSFGPQRTANLVDIAKVVTKAYGIAPLPSLRIQTGVPWHEPYWFALAKRNAIPETVKSRNAVLTRGEYAEILYRLRDERPTQGFRYKPSFVRAVAQNAPTAHVTDSFESPSNSGLSISTITTNYSLLSDGLLLQMHTENRRIARLTKRNALSSLENVSLVTTAHSPPASPTE